MDGTMQRLSSKCLIVISQLAFWSVLVPHGVYAQLATTWNVSYGGTSRAEEINISYEADLSKLGFGDFNGDGKTDVFYTHPGQGWFVSYGGTGRWEKINEYRVPVEELAFGDFNGDGKTDVFHRPPNSRDWLVSYGGTGRWEKINESRADLKEMAFGDFNGDGKTDVFFLGIPSRPKSPSDLRITKIDGRAMTVMWQDNSDREDGFHIRWVGTRPSYTTRDRSRTLKKRNIDSHSETNLSEGYTYCISVQAFNRGGKSPSSNEVCHMIPVSDKPSPPQSGASRFAVSNCHTDRRAVHVWTFDLQAGTWSEHGNLAHQWSNGSCPGASSPLIMQLKSGSSYRLVAVDPLLGGCGGVNDPGKVFCQRLLTPVIRGDENGPTLLFTVN